MPESPVILLPYSPQWPIDFRHLAAQLRTALGPLAIRIDHIGSTSVPDLCSKDIIDIQLTVADLQSPALLSAISAAGFELRPHILRDHVPPGRADAPADWDKRYFREPPGTRPAHIHVRVLGKPNQRYPLLFRDYLRAHPAAARAYAQLKERLAPKLGRPDYVEAKDPVCDLILQAAEPWAEITRWTPPPSDA